MIEFGFMTLGWPLRAYTLPHSSCAYHTVNKAAGEPFGLSTHASTFSLEHGHVDVAG